MADQNTPMESPRPGEFPPPSPGPRARGAPAGWDYDAVVVGTGAGGGTAGYALARAGRRVLFVERGGVLASTPATRDDVAMLVERRASYPEPLHSREGSARPLVGGVLGGSSSLYGAALLRAAPVDFTPGRFFADHLPRDQWEWPLDYADLAPYYTRAETLFRVCGDGDAFPLKATGDPAGYVAPPMPWQGAAGRLALQLEARGLAPFRLPLALDPATCLGCARCPGYSCPNQSRFGAADRCVAPAVAHFGAALWLKTELVGVERRGRSVEAVTLKGPDGRSHRVTTRVLVVAAGALNTPDLLGRLGLVTPDHPALGRHFMLHLGVLFAVVLPRAQDLHAEPHKQIGLADWYQVADQKLGYVQQLPPPPPRALVREVPGLAKVLPPKWIDPLYQRLLMLVGSIDDVPQGRNRVYRDSRGLHLDHRYHRDDFRRAALLKRQVLKALPRGRDCWVLAHVPKRTSLRLAHQVGTCRFGRNPATSVVNPECRLHAVDNAFVVDTSVLPSSLGVGPALTTIANALRVADILHRDYL